jgi:hypothetical protein
MAVKFHDVESYSYDFDFDAASGGPRLLQLWSSTRLLADVHFYPDGQAQPGPTIGPNLDTAIVSFPFSQLAPIVDLLRNESPVRLQIGDAPPSGYVFLGTYQEPVGEGEET